jgi:hypothetical protein
MILEAERNSYAYTSAAHLLFSPYSSRGFSMRFPALVLVLFAFSTAPIRAADDAAEAKAIVEKAIKATGAKIDDKPVAMTWKEKGTFTGASVTMGYAADWAFQGPDKYRFSMAGDFGGMKIDLMLVVNGEKAWESGFGKSQEVTGEKLKYVMSEIYQLNVISLSPLLKDKEFQLSTGGEKKVGDKTTQVVKVAQEKRPTITLYFDKESGLLVKNDMMVMDEFQGWKEVPEECYYEDYKEVNGRKYFTKMKVVRDGNTMIESKLFDQKPHEKLEAKLFEKP